MEHTIMDKIDFRKIPKEQWPLRLYNQKCGQGGVDGIKPVRKEVPESKPPPDIGPGPSFLPAPFFHVLFCFSLDIVLAFGYINSRMNGRSNGGVTPV